MLHLDCRVRLKTEMEKAVTVSLNIRKDSVAETLPPPRGNTEGSSNKQLELPGQHKFLTVGSCIEEFRNVTLRYVTS